MDWILGASVWEFNELGRDEFPVLTESSSTTEESKNVEFFHVDRGLDGLENDGTVKKMSKEKELVTNNKEAFAPKRAQGYNGNNQQTACLVDGCNADLNSCRDYHRRHRVCERHSKTPVVVIGGKELRFCQQCSRFHSLGEFDDVKRSCRKRLDGHNRRRRKPQPESLYLSCGNFLANHQGAKLLQFGSPEAQTTEYSSSLTWGNNSKYLYQTTSSNPTNHIYNGAEINSPFLLNKPNLSVPETLNMQALKSRPQKLTRLVKPKSALSLLSSHNNTPTTQIQTSRTFPSHLTMQQDVVHQNQRLQFDGVPQYLHSQRISQDLNGVFGFGSEGFLENEASQLISFSCN